jgi:hypothetical protein
MIMRKMLFATSLAASWALPLSAHDTLPEGIWTNAEDVYFAEEEDRKKAEWTGIEVGANGRWRMIDAFAAPRSEWSGEAIPGLKRREGGGWQIGASELRKARRFFCWVSVRKYQPKEDGSEAWTFQRNLANFDQGGRIFIDGKSEAPMSPSGCAMSHGRKRAATSQRWCFTCISKILCEPKATAGQRRIQR